MRLFEDKTIKEKPWGLWKFVPYGLAAIFISIISYVLPIPLFVWAIALLLILGFILFKIILKVNKHFSQENKEIREYEEEMRRRGR
jgi:F0F1-type ATP synthase assembly protein I